MQVSDSPASEVYWADAVRLPFGLAAIVALPLALMTYQIGRDIDGPEPRFRVVVGFIGSLESEGVAEVWTRRQANRALAKVNDHLATCTVDEFNQLYDVGGLRRSPNV